MIKSLHDEAVIEPDVEGAQEIAEWLNATLRKAMADVLGYKELAGEDAVATTVIEAWVTR